MWHEARKREKATQKLFNDHRKRAERRREENRVDPSRYLQVSGVKAKLSLDPNVYKQAATSMVAWQGDPKIMIDRFDVRATLESIPKDDSVRSRDKSKQTCRNAGVLDVDESKPMKSLLDYERYRLLIQNDLYGVAEESRLNLVAKSDILSDANLRKLKGNKFGTSGETFSAENPKFLLREQSRRVPIGPTYNSVPPPSSLSNSQNSSQTKSSWTSEQRSDLQPDVSRIASQVIDLDDYDNFDPDQVDIRDDYKQTGDVAKKYGHSSEELILLSKLDNKGASLKESLSELKILAKKIQIHKDKTDTSQRVYGPALPPELANSSGHRNAEKSSAESPSNDDDESDSPVPQRSPSGATMIPLRVESGACSASELSDNDDTSPNKPPATIPQPEATTQTELITVPKLKEECKLKEDQIASDGKVETQPEVRRRASTPLAYKRNCRSSRSLSRERRRIESKAKEDNRKRNSSSSSSSPSPDRQRHSSSRRHHRQEDRSRKRIRDR